MKLKHFVLLIAFLTFTFAVEGLSQTTSKEGILATGTFIQADVNDTLHWGKGMVTVYADRLELSDDFQVPIGPKYHVYAMIDKEILNSSDVNIGRLVDLGPLAHFEGAQIYSIPRGMDITTFGSVIIYCEGFKTLITPAGLNFVKN